MSQKEWSLTESTLLIAQPPELPSGRSSGASGDEGAPEGAGHAEDGMPPHGNIEGMAVGVVKGVGDALVNVVYE
jgi:hypothetical protein